MNSTPSFFQKKYKSLFLGVIFFWLLIKGVWFTYFSLVFAWVDIPSIKVTFQNPTYLLEKDIIKSTYDCDPLQSDCKVNFDLSTTFWGTVPSKYACSIDFWFPTWEEQKCNPSTVIFPKGEWLVSFKIYEKANPLNIQETLITIKDPVKAVEIPNITFNIQSGLESDVNGNYKCKTASCSVNLTVESLFTGSYLASNYQCLWDFWSGVVENSSSLMTCNPSYVYYPNYGNYSLSVIIQEKGNQENFKTWVFTFINDKALLPDTNDGGVNTWATLSWTVAEVGSGTLNVGASTELSQTGTIENGTGTEFIQTWVTDVWVGELNSQTWSISTGQILIEIPEIILTFQSPSYINETSSWTYECDNSQLDCKVNIDLRDTFWGYVPADFACRIDSKLFSGQETNCNPNTIIIPEGNFSVTFTIYEKLHPENKKEKQITFSHTKNFLEIPTPIISIQSGLKLTESGSYSCSSQNCSVNLTALSSFSWGESTGFSCEWDYWSGANFQYSDIHTCNPSYVLFDYGEHMISLKIFETANQENVKESMLTFFNSYQTISNANIPPVQISFQSPSYVNFDSWDGENLICDPKQSQCKVNFNIEQTFWGIIPSWFACKIDFWFETGEEGKCNPNTITFPPWESKVTFILYEKENPQNFQERTINITSNGFIGSWGGWGQITTSSLPREIILQSGGRKEGENIFCQTKECKVNLKYTPLSGEVCVWDFWAVNVSEDQKNTCNPSMISFPQGDTPLSLFIISSKTNQLLTTLSVTIKNNFTTPWNTPPVVKLSLQGKLSKKKFFEWDTLVCYTRNTCLINVTAQDTYDLDKDKLDYTWWFGNWQVSSKENPPSVLYPFGRYQIRLAVSDGKEKIRKHLTLEVKNEKDLKKETTSTGILDDIPSPSVHIRSVLPNPQWKDTNEYIEIQNTSFLSTNLKWISLTVGKKHLKVKEDVILKPYETRKFFYGDSHISLPNASWSLQISYNDEVLDSLFWQVEIPDGYILTHSNLERTKKEGKIIKSEGKENGILQYKDGSLEKISLLGIKIPQASEGNMFDKYIWKEGIFEVSNETSWSGAVTNGYFYIENTMLNKTLVEEGIARVTQQFPFLYQKEFLSLQTKAKKEKKWIWWSSEIKKWVLKEIREEALFPQNLPSSTFDVLWQVSQPQSLSANFSPLSQTSFSQIWGEPTSLPVPILLNSPFKKVTTNFTKVPFRINFTLLKSWLKISGSTLSGSTVHITWYTSPIEIQVGSDGKFLYKIDHYLVAGNYTLQYQVANGVKEYEIPRQKILFLSSEYTKQVDENWYKKTQRLAYKKTKKKKSPKIKTPPLTKVTQQILHPYETSSQETFPLWIFYIIWLIGIAFLSFQLNQKQLFDKK